MIHCKSTHRCTNTQSIDLDTINIFFISLVQLDLKIPFFTSISFQVYGLHNWQLDCDRRGSTHLVEDEDFTEDLKSTPDLQEAQKRL